MDTRTLTKKKLLVFHSALAPYRIDFFNSLAEAFDCKVVFLSRNNRNQHFDQKALLYDVCFKYEYMDYKLVIRDRDINFGYLIQLINFKPNIVFGGEYGLPLIIPFFYRLLMRKPFSLYTICDDSIIIAEKCSGIRKIIRNFLVSRIDGILFLSNQVADWYTNHFKLKNPPLVFPLIREETKYREQLERSLPISRKYINQFKLEGKRISLFVGRLDKVKNIDLLILAFDKVALVDDRLVIVGSGPEEENLYKLKDSLENKNSVLFVGRFEGKDLIAWYNIGHLFVLPSIYEPFGAVVNEALAAGCFVLCSVYAGSSTLINENNGILFRPDVPGELSEGLSKLFLKIGKFKTNSLVDVKPNLMPFSFKHYEESLIKKLK